MTIERLGIAIPGESMPVSAVGCLANLIGSSIASGMSIALACRTSSILPRVRQRVIEQCLDQDASHVLCLDSDMVYPPDIALRLAESGRPFVAANCPTRVPPIKWTAKGFDDELVDSTIGVGMERVKSVGVAVALIERQVFEKIETPWFNFRHEDGRWLGEDVSFCEKVRDAGIPIFIDHEASRQVGHIGEFIFDGSMVGDG